MNEDQIELRERAVSDSDVVVARMSEADIMRESRDVSLYLKLVTLFMVLNLSVDMYYYVQNWVMYNLVFILSHTSSILYMLLLMRVPSTKGMRICHKPGVFESVHFVIAATNGLILFQYLWTSEHRLQAYTHLIVIIGQSLIVRSSDKIVANMSEISQKLIQDCKMMLVVNVLCVSLSFYLINFFVDPYNIVDIFSLVSFAMPHGYSIMAFATMNRKNSHLGKDCQVRVLFYTPEENQVVGFLFSAIFSLSKAVMQRKESSG